MRFFLHPTSPALFAALALPALLAAGSREQPPASISATCATTPPAIAPVAAPQAAPGAPVQLPAELVIPDPVKRATDLERVEDWTEAVANTLFDFSDKLRRRDFAGAEDWLVAGFAGHAWDELPIAAVKDLPLATRKTTLDVSKSRIVDRAGFLESIASYVAPWRCVDFVLWKVKGAEFESQAPLACKLRFKITILGIGADGGPRSIVGWANARGVRTEDRWKLELLALSSLELTERASHIFSDVSVPAGVAHTSPRFGQEGASSFAWNGAAAGDSNNDGCFDIFVPSKPRNFLYVAQPGGGFVDRAQEAGVAQPAGGTGALFFDFDNDQDQDLAVADVGWRENNGSLGGNRLRLFANDGKGKFIERGATLGFDAVCHGYSMSAFDYDGDGWLDVYVANYGRIDVLPNDSWTDARNGTPDILLRNRQGQGFENVTSQVGLGDVRWSYACAAADYDLDGDTDLYVANDYGTNSVPVHGSNKRVLRTLQKSGQKRHDPRRRRYGHACVRPL